MTGEIQRVRFDAPVDLPAFLRVLSAINAIWPDSELRFPWTDGESITVLIRETRR